MKNQGTLSFFGTQGLLQMRFWAFATSLFVLAPLASRAQGGNIVFQAITSKKEVVSGGSVQVSFKFIGGVGGQLERPDFGAFQSGGGTQETSGMQIINGDMQGHHTWTFNLIAPAPGDYTIPAATVSYKGKKYTSNPIRIKVVPSGSSRGGQAPSQVPSGADPNIFITTELSATTAYPGQQVIVTLNIYTQINLAGLDMVRAPKPSGGTLKELQNFEGVQSEERIGGQRYIKQSVYGASYFPDAEGTITFSAGILTGMINQGGFLAPTRVLSLESQPVTLTVKPLPQPQPAGFSGLVGAYSVEMPRTGDSIGLGDASVISLEIRGNGNPRLLAPPVVQTPDGIDTFDPAIKSEETFENGQELVHTQAIEYTFSAKKEGEFVCTPLLVWFDPDSNKYVTWQHNIVLKVGPGSGPNAPIVSGNGDGFAFWRTSKGIGALALLAAGLLLLAYYFLNRKKEDKAPPVPETTPLAAEEPVFAPAKEQPREPDSWFMPPVVSETPIAVETVEEPPPAPPVPATVPLLWADSTWAQLERMSNDDGPSRPFYALLLQTIKENFAPKLLVNAADVEQHQALRWMQEKGYDTAETERMAWVWRTCEQVLYAAQDHSGEKVQALRYVEWLVRPVTN